ncbi:hypothetical protein ACR79S_03395 [Sphingobacterium spiritivorum]|uniref:hypothetical protein n=1 Tax=Sphingobacterium spiritivorum TaxID=258 RepID=UPI003DA4046A
MGTPTDASGAKSWCGRAARIKVVQAQASLRQSLRHTNDNDLPGERLKTAIPTGYYYLLTAKRVYCWCGQQQTHHEQTAGAGVPLVPR